MPPVSLPLGRAVLDVISRASQIESHPTKIIRLALAGGLLDYVRRSGACASKDSRPGNVSPSPHAALPGAGFEEEGNECGANPYSGDISFAHPRGAYNVNDFPLHSLPRSTSKHVSSDKHFRDFELILLPSPGVLSAVAALVRQEYFFPSLSLLNSAGKKGLHYQSATFPREAFTMLVLLFPDCFVDLHDYLESSNGLEGSSGSSSSSSSLLQHISRSPSPVAEMARELDGSDVKSASLEPELLATSDSSPETPGHFLCDERGALMAREEVALAFLTSINNILYHIRMQEIEKRVTTARFSQKEEAARPFHPMRQGSADCDGGFTLRSDMFDKSSVDEPDSHFIELSNLSLLTVELERLKVVVALCLCSSSVWMRESEKNKEEKDEEPLCRHYGNVRSEYGSSPTSDHGELHANKQRSGSTSFGDSSPFSPYSLFHRVSEGIFFQSYELQQRPSNRKQHDVWYDEMIQKIHAAYLEAHSAVSEGNGTASNGGAFPLTIQKYLECIYSRASMEARKLSLSPELLLYPPFDGRPSVVLTKVQPPIPAQPHMPLLPGEMSFLFSSSVLEIDTCEHPLSLFLHHCSTRRLGPSDLRAQLLFLDELTCTPLTSKSFMILCAFLDNLDNVFKTLEKNPEVLSQMVLNFGTVEYEDSAQDVFAASPVATQSALEAAENKEYHLAMGIVRTVLFARPFSVNVGKFLRELLLREFLDEMMIVDWMSHCCSAAESNSSLLPRKSTLSRSFFALVDFAIARLEFRLEPSLSQRLNTLRVNAA